MARLVDMFVSGAFPLLEALEVKMNSIENTSDTFFEAVKTASYPLRLTTLHLREVQMADEVLLSAIEMGRLPVLKRLLLEDDYITDRGLVALSQTIKGGHLDNPNYCQCAEKGKCLCQDRQKTKKELSYWPPQSLSIVFSKKMKEIT